MKSRFFATVAFLCLLLNVQPTFSQIKKLKNVSNQFTLSESPDVGLAKFDIDMVSENEETKNMAAMWGWRGVVYTYIASDSKLANMDPKNEAAKIAGQAFVKYYQFPESEQDRYEALKYANATLPSAIIACYNAGITAGSTKGHFEEVKMYMEMVHDLSKFDTEEKALSASVSKEKAIYSIWRAAYADSLVDQEVIYLNKLMDFPSYFNAEVFIRLSEIYSERKEYDKALTILDKGREKIPQKAGEFLDQQINIEIDRNNSAALIKKFTEAIETNPDNNSVYYYSRGVVYHNLKMDEVEAQDKASKAGETPKPSKYFYKQGLADYAKAIEVDPGFFDAKYNEASLLNDSANSFYKARNKLSGAEYDRATATAMTLYKDVLTKLEWIKESGNKKDAELLELLVLMRSIAAKTGQEEKRLQFDTQYKEEKKKLQGQK